MAVQSPGNAAPRAAKPRTPDWRAWTEPSGQWSDFAGHHPERLFNMTKREAQVPKLNTPFAETLKQRRTDLALPVLPSSFNLPLVLKDLQLDDHPMAVEVYIRLSRGVEILPPDLSRQIHPSRVANYKPKTPLLEPRRTLIQSRISDLRFGPNTVSRHPPYHMIHI
eukprot:COSAG01_NODE_11902_length_1837_cov_2.998274_1_plen_165_part_01